MARDADSSAEFPLLLTDEERVMLRELLERSLGEVRVEVHRTHTPDYRDLVLRQETVIRNLLAKVGTART
jgi:hypothetical protein